MRRVNTRKLAQAARELGDAAVDPSAWSRILEQISEAAAADGAMLLQSDSRTPDVPRTQSLEQLVHAYFADGWYAEDIRAKRCVPRLLGGQRVVLDQEIFTDNELQSQAMHNELVIPHGFQWFAAVGFYAGAALWGLSMQRTSRQGPFTHDEARILAALADRLTEVATLSTAVGRVAVTSAIGALDRIGQSAVAIGCFGDVLEVNHAAARVFGDHLYVDGRRRLCARDAGANAALQKVFDKIQATPDTEPLAATPIAVRRAGRAPVLIRMLPVPAAARAPFGGARALLTLSPIEPKPAPDPALLGQAFGLTRAEAQIAALVAEGKSLDAIAAQRGIALVTARNQLKAVFAKTGTRRQGELVALLSRL